MAHVMNETLPAALAAAIALLSLAGCRTALPPEIKIHHGENFGSIEILDPRLNSLIAPGTRLEKLASGFDWSEGPVWIKTGQPPVTSGSLAAPSGGYLLFSDVPSNTVYRWSAAAGVDVFLKPSGYTGSIPRAGEPGSNGLTVDSMGRLVLCEHGDRRIGRIEKDGRHVTVADRFMGKRFNSPNDLVFRSNGDLYFTDPPYGLEKNVDDPKKEIPFQGVYRVKTNGEITMLTDQISRPNGIAFSPDEKILYVACSDPKVAVWMAHDVKEDGTLSNARVFFDATSMVSPANKGLPDGMKVDAQGNLWATGPGGVFILSPDGKHLGTIHTGEATANCAWAEDGSTLYITADMFLCRLRTKVKGAGW
ncbi:MAG: gluconolactonase [Verrucomicrobiota bacterium]